MNSFNEIERKFLIDVSKLDLKSIKRFKKIEQGYLLRANNGSARVRLEVRPRYFKIKWFEKLFNILNIKLPPTKKAWLVIKQKIDDMTNNEIVCNLSYQEAIHLLNEKCSHPYITKTRYAIEIGKVKWEIDEFHGHKNGLILAEVELQDLTEEEQRNLQLPNWISKEVTGVAEYYNVNM